jgi:hypothetical protein
MHNTVVSADELRGRRRTAFIIGVASLLAVTAALAVGATVNNRGVFTYVVDDPYIHVTMARNLALSGTYGVVPGVYESASSSPGWVALLAGFIRVAPGSALWLPLALNVVAGIGVLALVLRAQTVLFTPSSALVRGLFAAALPLALFLPGLAMVGMEHTLHILLVTGLMTVLANALRRPLGRGELAGFAVLWALAAAVRYETLFFAAGAALALLVAGDVPGGLRNRLRRFEVWAALLPPLAITGLLGAINLANGQYFLPNSVVAKSSLGSGGLGAFVPSPGTMANVLLSDVTVAALLLAGLAYLAMRRLRGLESGLWLVWVVTLLLHSAYGRFGWFDRYQAYLVAAGLLLALRSLPPLRLPRLSLSPAVALGALLLLLPLPKFNTAASAPTVAHVVYRYQYLTAQLLAGNYPGRTVMAVDIGLVSYNHIGRLDDLYALGSHEVLAAYHAGQMGPAFLDRLAARDGVAVAVMYHGDAHYVPAGWTQVAHWSMGPVGPTESASDYDFWAPTPQLALELREHMRQFAQAMPQDMALALNG